jgi:hypothetical protein
VRSSVSVPDPGFGAILTPESGMNIHDHFSESLGTVFWVKILKFLDADLDLGSGIFFTWIRDPGWKKFRSGIRHKQPDPQHWCAVLAPYSGFVKKSLSLVQVTPTK